MEKDWTVAEVARMPKCDFCDEQAEYDGAINYLGEKGPWAYMCEHHFGMNGIQLGLGYGQRLVLVGGEA